MTTAGVWDPKQHGIAAWTKFRLIFSRCRLCWLIFHLAIETKIRSNICIYIYNTYIHWMILVGENKSVVPESSKFIDVGGDLAFGVRT